MINRKHILPIVIVVLGIIDQSTDLFTDLLRQLNAPDYVGTAFKILIIILGAIKLIETLSLEESQAHTGIVITIEETIEEDDSSILFTE